MIAIHTKYIAPSSTRGARIKAYTSDYELSDVMRHFQPVQKLINEKMTYAPSVLNMTYGDSADGRGYVFCFGESKVFDQLEA
jgi:hypothetical protein